MGAPYIYDISRLRVNGNIVHFRFKISNSQAMTAETSRQREINAALFQFVQWIHPGSNLMNTFKLTRGTVTPVTAPPHSTAELCGSGCLWRRVSASSRTASPLATTSQHDLEPRVVKQRSSAPPPTHYWWNFKGRWGSREIHMHSGEWCHTNHLTHSSQKWGVSDTNIW